MYDEKKVTEAKFSEWAANKSQYSSILSNYEKAYAAYVPYALHATYLKEGVMGSAIIAQAAYYLQLESLLKSDKPDPEMIKKATEQIKAANDEFYKSFNVVSEERILAGLTQLFYENIPADQHPAHLTDLVKKNKSKTSKEIFEKFAKGVFSKSFLGSKQNAEKFLAKPDLKKLQSDPAFAFTKAFLDNYNAKIKTHIDAFNATNTLEGSKYIKGLMEMQPDKKFYPDANRTLRLTYGTVKGYAPKDGVDFKFYTTLNGVIEKENPKDPDFNVPSKLKDLYFKKDFGTYADKSGEMRVAFLSNNDITGGNSGSPVLNANGELIGLAFDANWEAMSGDIVFDSNYKRTICNDIRYILFLIDKFGGATNLISEMNISK